VVKVANRKEFENRPVIFNKFIMIQRCHTSFFPGLRNHHPTIPGSTEISSFQEWINRFQLLST
jgi:hypothetical protein